MTATRRLIRSALYMPGSNTRALEKAQSLSADAIIMDLEDSVSPEEKVNARASIVSALETHDYADRLLMVRTNGLESPLFNDDVASIAATRADAVLIPKVSTVEEVDQATEALERAGASRDLGLWVMMETPLAILNAHAIAATSGSAGARLRGLVIGSNDLARLTYVDVSHDRQAMQSWFSTCVLAARASDLYVLDGPCNDFRDAERLQAECVEGATLGMDGKTLIHPGQIEITNRCFSPGPEKVRWAQQVLETFADPANQNASVVSMNGEMVERLHIEIAERILAASS